MRVFGDAWLGSAFAVLRRLAQHPSGPEDADILIVSARLGGNPGDWGSRVSKLQVD